MSEDMYISELIRDGFEIRWNDILDKEHSIIIAEENEESAINYWYNWAFYKKIQPESKECHILTKKTILI